MGPQDPKDVARGLARDLSGMAGEHGRGRQDKRVAVERL